MNTIRFGYAAIAEPIPPTEARDSVKNKTREPPCSENTKHLVFPLNLRRFHPLSPAPLSVCDLRLCWDDLQRSRQHLNGKMFNKIECLWCVLGILIYFRPNPSPSLYRKQSGTPAQPLNNT